MNLAGDEKQKATDLSAVNSLLRLIGHLPQDFLMEQIHGTNNCFS